jgi:PPK2 family polyphosphate:nucleotide phosphotransferase
MKIDPRRFRVAPGERHPVRRPASIPDLYKSKDEFRGILGSHVDRLNDLQQMLYATKTHALLIILQGMDTAGKDGTIRHVMSGVNPQGVQVFSFGKPSETELRHDFLWRETLCLPERGRIGIFNRSYYEEVLVVRVHPELLAAEGLADRARTQDIWQERFESIVDYERHLYRNGTRVVKFFLHISKEEQRRRLLKRLEDPKKYWKFNPGDVEERGYWGKYMRAYDAALSATSTRHAPWYVVPANDKRNARLIVSQAIIETLAGLKLRYPRVTPARIRELRAIRRRLAR